MSNDFVSILAGHLQVKLGTPKGKAVKILLDSGASGSLMRKGLAEKLRIKDTKSETIWTTASGVLNTNRKSKIYLELPELSDTLAIHCDVHLAKDLGRYDIILGRDILQELGIILNFKTKEVQHKHVSIPMVPSDEIESHCVAGIQERIINPGSDTKNERNSRR